MVTLEQARESTRLALEPRWRGPGTFYVAPWAYEDATAYSMAVGAFEWVELHDLDYEDTRGEVTLVDKATGVVIVHDVDATMVRRLQGMHPVGPQHPETV